MNDAAEVIYDLVDAQANLIFGAVVDPAMKNGEVRCHAVKRPMLSRLALLHMVSQAHRPLKAVESRPSNCRFLCCAPCLHV